MSQEVPASPLPKPLKLLAFTAEQRQEIADLLQAASNRYGDSINNPLEAEHYSEADLAELHHKRERARHWQVTFENNLTNPEGA